MEKIDYWKEVGTDPYKLPGIEESERMRKLLKQVLLSAINAKDKETTEKGVRYAIFKDLEELGCGMCQPVLDSYFKVNVFLTAPAALRVGKLTWSTLVPRSSGLIGLIATQSGGIGTRGRPRTKRSGC
jgi:hypothetical protein